MKTVYMKIEGRVQRIGFRRWAVSNALELGNISGWVRNLDDGSVEILMQGEDAVLNEMIRRCYVGPIFSRVDKISFVAPMDISFLPLIKEGMFLRL